MNSNSLEPEKTVEKKFVAKCKEKGWTTIKLGSLYIAGWPDRLVLLGSGKVGFVELKRKDGSLTLLQKTRLRELHSHGYYIDVIYGLEEISDGISRLEAYYQTGVKLSRVPEERD